MKKLFAVCIAAAVCFNLSAGLLNLGNTSDLIKKLDDIYNKMIYWDDVQATKIDNVKVQLSSELQTQNSLSEQILAELKLLNAHFGESTSSSTDEDFREIMENASQELKKVDELVSNVETNIKAFSEQVKPIEEEIDSLNDKYDAEIKSVMAVRGTLSNDWISQSTDNLKKINVSEYIQSYQKIKKDAEDLKKPIETETDTVQQAIEVLNSFEQSAFFKADDYYEAKASGKESGDEDDAGYENWSESELSSFDSKIDYMDNVTGKIYQKRQVVEGYAEELKNLSSRIGEVCSTADTKIGQLKSHQAYIEEAKKK